MDLKKEQHAVDALCAGGSIHPWKDGKEIFHTANASLCSCRYPGEYIDPAYAFLYLPFTDCPH